MSALQKGKWLRGLLVLSLLAPAAAWAEGSCPPEGTDASSLALLKETKFAVDDDTRQTLALALLDCLGSPDPKLRDGIAYEAFTEWLRSGQLSPELRAQVCDRRYKKLEQSEEEGFLQPFGALVLSEIARTDRTVSCTHLEGYKRQSMGLRARVIFIPHKGHDFRSQLAKLLHSSRTVGNAIIHA